LPTPGGDIEEIIAFNRSQNGIHEGCLRDQLDSVQEIATISMNGPDKAMNLVVFYAAGFLMNSHQKEVLQNSHYPPKFWQPLSIHGSALELTQSPKGVSHPKSVAMLFRLVRTLSLI
jgi:hypothetical protein